MAKKEYPFSDAELDFCAGVMSVNAIAIKHGIPEPTLRREAKKRCWIRGATESKRQLVKDAMAGLPTTLTKTLTNDEVRQKQEQEAALDVNDMQTGLALFRAVLAKCVIMIDEIDAPRDIKIISEAGKNAIDGIRKIRGLDDLAGAQSLGEFLASSE